MGTLNVRFMAEKKTWIVLTSGDEPLPNISRQLQQTGFTVDSVLEAIGQIVVKGSTDMKKDALKIKGVTDVIPSQEDINIGPPDLDTTW